MPRKQRNKKRAREGRWQNPASKHKKFDKQRIIAACVMTSFHTQEKKRRRNGRRNTKRKDKGKLQSVEMATEYQKQQQQQQHARNIYIYIYRAEKSRKEI